MLCTVLTHHKNKIIVTVSYYNYCVKGLNLFLYNVYTNPITETKNSKIVQVSMLLDHMSDFSMRKLVFVWPIKMRNLFYAW